MQVEEKAYAKVNMALDVVGLREDGYHEMKMINHCINLTDVLYIKEVERKGGLTVAGNPLPKDNTLLETLSLIRRTFGINREVDIFIKKRIPERAGLGGGSADAAALLRALNRLWDLGLSEEELRSLGLQIGADVPYCICRSTALVEGIGEKITPLPALAPYYLVLVKPVIDIETRWAFQQWDRMEVHDHPRVDLLAQAIREGKDLREFSQYAGNAFETIVFGHYPQIETIKQDMVERGAALATMSGTGSTIIGYFTNRAGALKAAEEFSKKQNFVFLTETLEEK